MPRLLRAQRAATLLRPRALAGIAVAGIALLAAGQSLAQSGGDGRPPARMSSSGGRVSGMFAFQKTCAACHTQEGADLGGHKAPGEPFLQSLAPEYIYESLVSGKMQAMAAGLTDDQKRHIAEWLADKPIGNGDAGDIKSMTHRCSANPPLRDPAAGPAWNGWSPGKTNTRFQPAAEAGLTPDKVPSLKLKWAFGIPAGSATYSQPSVVSGRVFFGSDTGFVYALAADNGCAYWSFQADSGIRSAITIGPISGYPGTSYAAYFGDTQGRIYALDAQNGKLLWKSPRVDTQAGAHITASVTLHKGRLFIPTSAGETFTGSNPAYECCKTRGVVTALDANTGKTLWRTETIAEPARPTIKNANGIQQWGPAGASVWNSPTIDEARNLVYVGTGNGYTSPAASTTDAILALDIDSGKIVWSYQQFRDDAFITGCHATNAAGSNCPPTLGPDWDFGGASAMLLKSQGGDRVIAAGKGGVAISLNPDHKGDLLWGTKLYEDTPPDASGLVVFGGAIDDTTGYFPLNQPGGGLAAVRLADGKRVWTARALTKEAKRGQSAAATVIPGVVFTGAWDGVLRALSTTDGKVVWEYDTHQDFQTVNGVAAKGGSLGAPGAVIVDGMLFVGSGYIGAKNGFPGNVILAFAP